jgi:hypothetical protein
MGVSVENIAVALVGAVGVIAGALIAVLGTMLAEKQRQRTAQQRWELDVRRDAYWQLLEASRLMRNESYRALRLDKDPDPRPKRMLAEAIAKAELVASESSMRRYAKSVG